MCPREKREKLDIIGTMGIGNTINTYIYIPYYVYNIGTEITEHGNTYTSNILIVPI